MSLKEGATMLYFSIYLCVGVFFVLLKTPIRKLVDDEISQIKLMAVLHGDEAPPTLKLILFRIVLSIVLIFIYPIMLLSFFSKKYKMKKDSKVTPEVEFISDPSTLKEKLTIDEAEAENIVDIDGVRIAFGHSNKEWLSLCRKVQKNDELYYFKTPQESWDNLAGKAGISLVRKGKIVAEIITLMS